MQVARDAAKSDLARLIDAALDGEEVIIARDHEPIAKLVAIDRRTTFAFGLMAEQLAGPAPDFLQPMDEDEPRAWEGSIESRP